MAGEKQSSAERILSVDALRGFDMFWIVGGVGVVHSLIEVFWNPLPPWLEYQFHHVDWQGFSAWDLIMPLFLFVVGVSMPFSFAKRLEQGENKRLIYRHVVRRVIILWVLGMIAQGNLLQYDFSKLHFYSNTLQSIASGYLVGSIALIELGRRGRIVLTGVLLLGYWALMALVPVPGHGSGVLEPQANLALYIDQTLMGRFRADNTYSWILSSMTFAATVLLGIMGGELLRSKLPPYRKVAWLTAAGAAGLGLGQVWGVEFPIIKHLWTSSMVLYAAGWSFLMLALFYLVIDVWGFRKWTLFFIVIGMNAIAVYMAVEV
ncbi:MAG: DUF5009 domain-containing protein, partial [Elusimicrobia bacterium]|nr:DUF5009 domain-containing protein [Elusimicrobiota bacterium]